MALLILPPGFVEVATKVWSIWLAELKVCLAAAYKLNNKATTNSFRDLQIRIGCRSTDVDRCWTMNTPANPSESDLSYEKAVQLAVQAALNAAAALGQQQTGVNPKDSVNGPGSGGVNMAQALSPDSLNNEPYPKCSGSIPSARSGEYDESSQVPDKSKGASMAPQIRRPVPSHGCLGIPDLPFVILELKGLGMNGVEAQQPVGKRKIFVRPRISTQKRNVSRYQELFSKQEEAKTLNSLLNNPMRSNDECPGRAYSFDQWGGGS